jgi:hypothetical protein
VSTHYSRDLADWVMEKVRLRRWLKKRREAREWEDWP